MTGLMRSDKDGSGPDRPGPVSPDLIDWSFVTKLSVMDMQFEGEPRRWTFLPYVVFTDDTWREVGAHGTAAEARARCATLSAIHDKPVQDWTRPAPPGLVMESTREQIRATMAVQELHYNLTSDLTPEQEKEDPPVWGSGWEQTDYLFLEGATDEEFLQAFAEMETILIASWDEVTPEETRRAVSIVKSEAVRRWHMLHAANDKPAPRREVAPA